MPGAAAGPSVCVTLAVGSSEVRAGTDNEPDWLKAKAAKSMFWSF
jgi:hypothetical protein